MDSYELKTRIVGLNLALQDEIQRTTEREVTIAKTGDAPSVVSALRERLSESFAPDTTLVRGSATASPLSPTDITKTNRAKPQP
jgi:hypothetical protein